MKREDLVFSVPELRDYLLQKGVARQHVDRAVGHDHDFNLLIPKYYVDLIDWTDPDDPLARMVVVSDLERDIKPYEVDDPIGDKPHSPVPGIIHRHRDRCLLMLTNVCAVHCRFCFRKNLLSDNRYDLARSIEYISGHPEIWEVILSGGDPFTFTDHFMQLVMNKLRAIDHVRMIRFHTRTPVVYPARVTPELVTILEKAKPYTVVFHINHVREITPNFCQAVELLQKSGAIMLSQTVLLKGVNDRAEALEALYRGLMQIGVKPYYLHHLDPAAGTHHFRRSVEDGLKIYSELERMVPGHCVPRYVIDVPGGHGKIPVRDFKLIRPGVYEATSFRGERIEYTDHADG